MRVMVADQDAEVRSALRLLIMHVLGLQVVGEATAAVDLWTQVQDARPDLLLLEWGLVGAVAGATLARLSAEYPHLQIVVLSCRPEERQQALAAGADAFVCKADSPAQTLNTLRAVCVHGGAGRAAEDSRAMGEGTDA